MKVKIVAAAAALLALVECGPIVKRQEDCPDESSTVVADAIRAVVSTSELPTYPGGYQPLPYGPKTTLSSGNSSSTSLTTSISTAPGIPSSSIAGGVTASRPTKQTGTGASSSKSSTTTDESSTGTGVVSSITATNGSSSATASATETGSVITIETISVSLNSSSSSYTGSPYSPYRPWNATSYAGGTGTHYPQRPVPTGSFSTGTGPGKSTTHVTSVLTLSLTKTTETTIHPSGSWDGPINSNNSTVVSSPVTGSGSSGTEHVTVTSTSSSIMSIIITLSNVSPTGTGIPTVTTVSIGASTIVCSGNSSSWHPCWPPSGTAPVPYNHSSIQPTGLTSGGVATFPTATFPTASAPYPYGYSHPAGTGSDASSSGFMTYTNASTAGPVTGTLSTPSLRTTTFKATLTLTIPPSSSGSSSGFPTPPGPNTSPSTTHPTVPTGKTTGTITSTSTITETISIPTAPTATSSPVASSGSPINSSNSTLPGTGTGYTSSTSTPYIYPYAGYTPRPEASVLGPPSPFSSSSAEVSPATASASEASAPAPTNTPFPVHSTTGQAPEASKAPMAEDDMPKPDWWAAFMRWWQRNVKKQKGRKHGRKGKKTTS